MEKLQNLIRAKRRELKMSQTAFGDLIGANQRTVSDLERGITAMPRGYLKLADVLGLSEEKISAMMAMASIEADKTERMPPTVRASVDRLTGILPNDLKVRHVQKMGERDVPVYGRALGGIGGEFQFNGEIMGWETRPPVLDGVKDAYAIYVDGESMYPRYKPGETVWVNPNRPPRRGDDVIVQLHPIHEDDPPMGYIKEFIAWTPEFLIVTQHNPRIEVMYPRDDVKSIHYVAFSQK